MKYIVKSGDTLSGIGAKYGVNWHTIATTNGINSPYVIHPGQKLTIPTSGSSSSSSSSGSSSSGGSSSANSGKPYDFSSMISLVINGVILYGIYSTVKKVL